jgi:hypothetical protein
MSSLYENPEFYMLARTQLEPVDPEVFQRIHGLVEDVVALNLSVSYGHLTVPGAYLVNVHPDNKDLKDGILYEDERDGFTRLDGRLVDARLFSPSNTLRQTVGATAFVGIALTSNLPVQSLWVMSNDGSNSWMIEHDAGYTISDCEIEKLEEDLTKLVVNP